MTLDQYCNRLPAGLRVSPPAAVTSLIRSYSERKAAWHTMDNKHVLGVDIGGTKIAVGLVDASGKQVAGDRIDTKGPHETMERVVAVCRDLIANAGVPKDRVAAVGIGCAGPIDGKEGRVKAAPNLPGWSEIPLVSYLQDALQLPTYLENDANAAAVGEFLFGAGRGHKNMVYMTVSTGVGGGVVTDGRLYRGENGNAAELGHITIAWDGRQCNCGNRGCLEAYASGTGLAKRAQELVRDGQLPVLLELAGSVENITAETVVSAVRQGDAEAKRLWDETMEILGAGIASVINTFNPSRIVLGGGLTKAGDLLFEPVRKTALARAMPPLAEIVDIVPAELGDAVGVVGAAAVAFERLQDKEHGR